MPTHPADLSAALATLQRRWGSAAPRRGSEPGRGPDADDGPIVIGALAAVPAPRPAEPEPDEESGPLTPAPRPFDDAPAERAAPDDGRIVPTGFAALDAILGPGDIPRLASVAFHGDHSSGKTTLALRLAAEAQNGGAIVAYLDLARSFDPVEAVARGVRLEWLVVLAPATVDEGLAMAGTLLQGRAVDLLLIDVPAGLKAERPPPGPRGKRTPGIADRLHRLAALARLAGTLLVVLEPPGLPPAVVEALGESVGLRLELARRAWLRLGRDVVGQQTEVLVARNRFGPPGRRADLRIVYADGGDRDACLAASHLLRECPVDPVAARPLFEPDVLSPRLLSPRGMRDATPPPALATPADPPRPRALGGSPLHALPTRPHRPGRSALDRRDRARPQPSRGRDGNPARDAARERAPARAGSGLPRS